ncbi:MAG TPA: hypothetical protein VND91_04245 [Candidatus Saccharimonadia bacterium]|nr:hypothetical protein [Candidatus Saccharimonadia bacterium]
MNQLRTFLHVTLALFALLTVAHIVRAATGTLLRIGDVEIAAAVSWPLAALTAALAIWAASLARAQPRP